MYTGDTVPAPLIPVPPSHPLDASTSPVQLLVPPNPSLPPSVPDSKPDSAVSGGIQANTSSGLTVPSEPPNSKTFWASALTSHQLGPGLHLAKPEVGSVPFDPGFPGTEGGSTMPSAVPPEKSTPTTRKAFQSLRTSNWSLANCPQAHLEISAALYPRVPAAKTMFCFLLPQSPRTFQLPC